RPPPTPVVWCLRWLVFRIMLGAGLIKLRGDPCWLNFTCVYYHYETQPLPNPLSWRLHFMPHWFHQLGVLFNHLAELAAPWFAFGPRAARHAAGTVLLDLLNTYGAFGTVGRERREIVFEGTRDEVLGDQTRWLPYEFKCKPGDPERRPCIIAPYQYRIDWQIWFAAMSTADRYPWTLHLMWKLLHNDPGALSLLATNPFPDAPPRWIRARLYRYEFVPPGDPTGAWWKRTALGAWISPLSADDPRLRRFLAMYGWS